MANTFRVNTKADLTTNVITDAAASVLTAGTSPAATLIILSILVSNKTGVSSDVDVFLDKSVASGEDDVYLIRNAPVPAGSSLEIISGSKIIVESGDVVRARADTATSLDITISYLEQTP
jgi:hypothetical protein